MKNKTVSFLELAFADLKFVAEVVSMRVKKYRHIVSVVDGIDLFIKDNVDPKKKKARPAISFKPDTDLLEI